MKRAVAYIRVSTKSDAQLHSYDYQVNYWKKQVAANYEYVGVYSDWGISGRSLAKRPELLRLIEDAKNKKFDVVFTKSVSRFARNTTELLETVRNLRDIGIKIFFEKENIDTFDPSAELFLTIAAAIAENDLKIYSENQRWSYKDRFKNGYVAIGSKILGYKMDYSTNTLMIVPSQKEVVKKIYELYLSGLGLAQIVLKLQNENIKNIEGKVKWSPSSIQYILQNEKYIGYNLSQKGYNENGAYKINRGQMKQYFVEDTHEAIISKVDFDMVQKIMKERATKTRIGHSIIPPYPFTKKVECGVCGHGFTHKFNNTNKLWRNAIWSCNHQNKYGKSHCDNTRIKDDVLKEKFVECYNEFVTTKKDKNEVKDLKAKLTNFLKEENELNALKVNHMIELDDYKQEVETLQKEINIILKKISDEEIRGVTKNDLAPIQVFTEEKVNKFLEKVIVYKHTVTFRFVNGVEIMKTYTNGPSGNKKGWKALQLARSKEE